MLYFVCSYYAEKIQQNINPFIEEKQDNEQTQYFN